MTETSDQPKTKGQRHPRPPLDHRGAYNLKESANYIGVSPISIRRLIERDLIKPNRALRHIVIAKAELDRFLSA